MSITGRVQKVKRFRKHSCIDFCYCTNRMSAVLVRYVQPKSPYPQQPMMQTVLPFRLSPSCWPFCNAHLQLVADKVLADTCFRPGALCLLPSSHIRHWRLLFHFEWDCTGHFTANPKATDQKQRIYLPKHVAFSLEQVAVSTYV